MQSIIVPFGYSTRGTNPLPSQEVKSEAEQWKWSAFLTFCCVWLHLGFNFSALFMAGIFCAFSCRFEEITLINYAPVLRSCNVRISEKFYPCLWKIWFLFLLNGWELLRYFLQFWRKTQQFSQDLDINNIVYAVSTLVVLCLCKL